MPGPLAAGRPAHSAEACTAATTSAPQVAGGSWLTTSTACRTWVQRWRAADQTNGFVQTNAVFFFFFFLYAGRYTPATSGGRLQGAATAPQCCLREAGHSTSRGGEWWWWGGGKNKGMQSREAGQAVGASWPDAGGRSRTAMQVASPLSRRTLAIARLPPPCACQLCAPPLCVWRPRRRPCGARRCPAHQPPGAPRGGLQAGHRWWGVKVCGCVGGVAVVVVVVVGLELGWGPSGRCTTQAGQLGGPLALRASSLKAGVQAR